jgi:hypothetical protein
VTIAERLATLKKEDFWAMTQEELFGLMPILSFERFEIYRDGSSRIRP